MLNTVEREPVNEKNDDLDTISALPLSGLESITDSSREDVANTYERQSLACFFDISRIKKPEKDPERLKSFIYLLTLVMKKIV